MSNQTLRKGLQRFFGSAHSPEERDQVLKNMRRLLTPDQAYERLEALYEIGKYLAVFETVEETLPKILKVVTGTLPFLSAVMVEKRGEIDHATIWPTDGLDQERLQKTIERARASYFYFAGSGNMIDQPTGRHESRFLNFPLVVDFRPVFGVLQLEFTSALNEVDVRFASTLTDLISVAIDRLRRIKQETLLQQTQLAERSGQLAHSQEQVTEMASERDQREWFVSTLSHDLRTPLTSARMYADLIIRQPQSIEVSRDRAEKIVGEIKRADKMIHDLLDANLIRAGEKLRLEIDHCDLALLAEETKNVMAAIHGDRFNLKFGQAEIWGYWSRDALRRVLENLLNNAVKYGSSSQPITLSIEQSELSTHVAVHNEGNPISMEDQARVFEQFTRTDSAQKSGRKGWGLGLALVHGIVAAHGGKVWVESRPWDGTTFHINIPNDARPSTD
ncbi:MAG: GAF domain-containing sensor histidine kinase [Bdellovibrionota bacterium]